MIPKGNARGGGQQLATHLLNAYDNDSVQVVEVRGAIARDLHGAFAEWHAQSKATKCVKYLYSLSVNPPPDQGPFGLEKYHDFISRAEKRLRLVGQPRAVVFHVKEGRQHCHVVWSRIEIDKMKAVQLSHDRQKLRFVAQEFAKTHGITLPLGMRNNRGLERFNFHAKGVNLAENQQKERTGVPKEERMRLITEAWAQSTDARSFVDALEARGYYLARGDRRGHVVVDLGGDVHSLYREVENVKGKTIQQRLKADYAPETLRDVHSVIEYVKELRAQRLEEKSAEPEKTAITPEQRRADLKKDHAERRAPLQKERSEMLARHRGEQAALIALQRGEDQGVSNERARGKSGRVLSFLKHITGIQLIVDARQRKADKARSAEHGAQQAALLRRHSAERQEIDRKFHNLDGLDKRERRSLETEIRREEFRRIATRPARLQQQAEKGTQAGTAKSIDLAKEFRRMAAQRTTAPAAKPGSTSDAFKRAATAVNQLKSMPAGKDRLAESPDTLSQEFKKAADPAPESGSREKETDSKKPASGAKTLSEEFRRRAEERKQEREAEKKPPPRTPGRDRGK